MLRFALLSLVCAVSAGVFGFSGSLSPWWVWGQVLFLIFLVLSAVGFMGGLMAKPTGLQTARINDRSGHGRPAKDIHGG